MLEFYKNAENEKTAKESKNKHIKNCFILYGPDGKKMKDGIKKLYESYYINKEELKILKERSKVQTIIKKMERYKYDSKIVQLESNIKKIYENIRSLYFSTELNNVNEICNNIESILKEVSDEDTITCTTILEIYELKLNGIIEEFDKDIQEFLNKKIELYNKKIKEQPYLKIDINEYKIMIGIYNTLSNMQFLKDNEKVNVVSNHLMEIMELSDFVKEQEKTIPQKRKQIPKKVREDLWKTYFGKTFIGKCYVCEQEIEINNFEAGHVQAAARGGLDDISNLKPVCRGCNIAMGFMNMEEYKETYYKQNKKQ
jgi:hypothetical protein